VPYNSIKSLNLPPFLGQKPTIYHFLIYYYKRNILRGLKVSNLKDIYEKAGLFYVGKDVNKDNLEVTEALTLLKNKNFTTHAAIIGMTGSGKTGLGIGLLEEAAIDNIPSIVIDPKGDMGDMLLTDPSFSPLSFKPWVEDDAKAKGEDPLEYAAKIANMWREGIYSWGQDEDRVAKFAAVDKTIFTPGSSAGVPINILSSLSKPSSEILDDADNFSAYLSSTVGSLLALINIEANPLESKEFILLSQIIAHAWRNGESMGLDALVGAVINPPFKKIGVLPIESFYPESERFKLANKFNSVIASPSFMGWLQGEDLDIQRLLYGKDGKAKVAIFSIAHLNDSQRMFFVTLLLNKVVAWMRRQSGSNRLKAMLYMDEIYGFFPPTKNPPSKEPMITLLKQARAYGLGVVLSTQNPVDLDYKGLSNIGTWFVGRLQTTQDINRVIDGLGGKIDSSISKKEIATLLANLKKRTFFLKSAHLDDIRLFGTRWVLSYLKGPLKKDDISSLMADKKDGIEPKAQELISNAKDDDFVSNITLSGNVVQRFEADITGKKEYTPTIGASVEVAYIDARRGIDETKELELTLNLDGLNSCDWDNEEELDEPLKSFSTKAPKGAKFKPLPDFISEDKSLKQCARALKEHIYTTRKLELYRCKKLRLESEIDESYDDFVVRVQDVLRDKFEDKLDDLKSRYKKKFDRLESQIERAQAQVEKEKADQTNSLIGAGISIISALFGRSSVTKIGRAVNKSGRVMKERGDISRAEARLDELNERYQEMQDELEDKIDELNQECSLDNYEIDTIFIKPRKSAIDINEIALLWRISY